VERQVRRVVLLTAEPPSGRGVDDPKLRPVAFQGVLQRVVDVVRALHAALHDEHAVLHPGGHPLVLEVDVLLRCGLEDVLDHVGGRGERFVDISLLDPKGRQDVVIAVLDLGRGRCCPEVEHRLERVNLDRDRLDGAADHAARGVRHQHNRLVDVTDLGAGQDRLIVLDQIDLVWPGDVPVVDDHEL
jgi:hypothetical protein